MDLGKLAHFKRSRLIIFDLNYDPLMIEITEWVFQIEDRTDGD